MEGSIRCPRCGEETPAENLSCIFCGATLPHRLGVFSGLRYGWRGILFLVIAGLIILSFLALVL
ncbi:MAG: hypothetical protein PHN82_09120 [bacterium]|nr:hypothetical protein [bacterium]